MKIKITQIIGETLKEGEKSLMEKEVKKKQMVRKVNKKAEKNLIALRMILLGLEQILQNLMISLIKLMKLMSRTGSKYKQFPRNENNSY